MAGIVDPYCMTAWNSMMNLGFECLCLAYFDRYAQVKVFQLQGADDEFFLPDSEVQSDRNKTKHY